MGADSRLRSPGLDELFDAVLTMRTRDDCYAFFEDLCTIGELRSMEHRFDVAKKLAEGKHYQEIAAETGASTATISRVKRCLDYGADGYRLALERLARKAGE